MTEPVMVNPRPAQVAEMVDATVSPLLSAFAVPTDVTPADAVTNSPSLFLDREIPPPPDDMEMTPPVPPPPDPEDVDRITPETFIAEVNYTPPPPANHIRPDELREAVLPLTTPEVGGS